MEPVVNYRAQAKERLSVWFNKSIIVPAIDVCKDAGLSDEETNVVVNMTLVQMFRGLNGF